jgi:hypothetical protein
MYYIYTNNPQFLFELKIKLPIKVFVNFEKFQNIKSNSKIIVYLANNNFDEENFNFYKNLSETANFVFVLNPEFWKSHVDLMQECEVLTNLYWCYPGFLNFKNNINILFYGERFYRMEKLYKNIPHKIKEINPYDKKEYYFEALLGLKKIHRDFIFSKIKNSINNNKFLYNYSNLKDSTWFNEPNINFLKNIDDYNSSLMLCEYYGKNCSVSQVIVIDLFNNSSYSIAAETIFINDYTYITEKTVKPIIGKRLFIIFSGANFLKNLQSLGFKTFDGIIDESYDQILDNEERWAAAWQQVEWLCNQDQQKIYEKIKPICEYNFNLMMETDWISITGESIKNIIT